MNVKRMIKNNKQDNKKPKKYFINHLYTIRQRIECT